MLALVLLACDQGRGIVTFTSPATVSRDTGSFQAGVGISDITPPLSWRLGLAGNGPDGLRADWVRHPLQARALALKGSNGELAVILGMDLPAASLTLREAIVRRVHARQPAVDSHNLLLLASHTHLGPSHYFDARLYNTGISSVRGFDLRVVNFLADRAADAVLAALADLENADATWTRAMLPGVALNRSPEAHLRVNGSAPLDGLDPQSPEYRRRAADSVASLLVLTRTVDGSSTVIGGWWNFGYHPTTHVITATFYDPDVPGRASGVAERILAQRRGGRPVLVFGNGANGDVAPAIVFEHPCNKKSAWFLSRPPIDAEMRDRRDEYLCQALRAQEATRVAADISSRLVRSIETALQPRPDSEAGAGIVNVASLHVNFMSRSASEAICNPPVQGIASGGGAEGARSSFYEGTLLGWDPGLREGTRRRRPVGCQGYKQPFPSIVPLALGIKDVSYPRHAVFTAIRVGDHLIVGIPFEPTVASLRHIRNAVLDSVQAGGVRDVIVTGLANTYFGYLAAPAEYDLQHYEGASTLYGPGTLDFVTTLATQVAMAAIEPTRRRDLPQDVIVHRGSRRKWP